MLEYSFIGSADTVKYQMQAFVDKTQVDEIMVVTKIFDHTAKVHSYELLAQLQKNIKAEKIGLA